MKELEILDKADREFIKQAIAICDRLDPNAVLLLTGSRAAGFVGAGADLDLWILGNKKDLTPEEQNAYATNGSLFVDRGDLRAHYEFFDITDLTESLQQWFDEKMWIVSQAKFIQGNRGIIDDLKECCAAYPHEVAEKKLKWLVANCRANFSSFPKSGDSKPIAGFMVLGRIIEYLCKMCCIAQYTPFPYTKWLVRVAKETQLGTKVVPLIERSMAEFETSPFLPVDTLAPDWPPRRELMNAFNVSLVELQIMGWDVPWLDDPWKAVDNKTRHPMP